MRINDIDKKNMEIALLQAKIAFKKNEIPIGAIIVDNNGKIIGKGHNLTETKQCQSRHAEVIAIEKATKKTGTWRLSNCILYSTLEPCYMCISLICLSRIERLVFGAKSPIFGCHLDIDALPSLYKKQLRGISSGVLAKEAEALLKNFFKPKRKEVE